MDVEYPAVIHLFKIGLDQKLAPFSMAAASRSELTREEARGGNGPRFSGRGKGKGEVGEEGERRMS